MGLFPRKKKPPVSGSILQSAARAESQYALPETQDPCEPALYAGLRRAVPVIDAAIGKIVRLTGSFQLVAGDSRMQEQLDEFVRSVPVGLTGQSLQTFADAYLDSLLTYGNALGEMLIDNRTGYLGGLQTVPAELVQIRPGSHPLERQYWLRGAGVGQHPHRQTGTNFVYGAESAAGRCVRRFRSAWAAGAKSHFAAHLCLHRAELRPDGKCALCRDL